MAEIDEIWTDDKVVLTGEFNYRWNWPICKIHGETSSFGFGGKHFCPFCIADKLIELGVEPIE